MGAAAEIRPRSLALRVPVFVNGDGRVRGKIVDKFGFEGFVRETVKRVFPA
jgi:hypothetical protein